MIVGLQASTFEEPSKGSKTAIYLSPSCFTVSALLAFSGIISKKVSSVKIFMQINSDIMLLNSVNENLMNREILTLELTPNMGQQKVNKWVTYINYMIRKDST